MRTLKILFVWLGRIPIRFTATFVALSFLWLFGLSRLVNAGDVRTLADLLLRATGLTKRLAEWPLVRIGLDGIVVLLLLGLGILLAYNLSAWIYRRIRTRPRLAVTGPVEPAPGEGAPLDRFQRIGIILAGGGAKGAYQAGALKAIHEFLERHGALDRVRMIAGTSIGSWNAMFWLADLVKSPDDRTPSAHERWWRSIGIDRIIEFDTYVPLRRNHFLRPTPWREAFRQIFAETPAVRERLARLYAAGGSAGGDPPVHFYFTRSNVEAGHLEFATNWTSLRDLYRSKLGASDRTLREPVMPPDRYEIIEGDDLADNLARTERAVFASMDLPPLFPYVNIKVHREEWFEDGGVVENLPVRFGTELEGCDLLFVLPLNASFAEPVDHASVARRLFRVMDVRQGVMERGALKMVYLYNELAALRHQVATLDAAAAPQPEHQLADTALRRKHAPVSVFAICPQAPLAIGTTEFWKPVEAGSAFDLMYSATRYELEENFERDTDPSWIRMTLVGPQGERTYVDDF
jgi:predicted acylesterase/phospholipase RssA